MRAFYTPERAQDRLRQWRTAAFVLFLVVACVEALVLVELLAQLSL
ncbi:MAG: hypothetical protein NZ473_06990 [Candidatus Kapabacteria bacterium]|nr:hypothetical protein [Candidatus Kapabacteria bacterium]MCS7170652.1 hypothetical protein [Candidatus Kapabacteria bacterium]MDW7997382.1 hypothetical protein [Bacteroidota bacterium]MDW8225403.1 hypothetical protein [Bacteroidota bacterium]